MAKALSLSQICFTAPQLVIKGCQSSGSLGDVLFEHLCYSLLLVGALSLLQSNPRLVGCNTQEESFDFSWEINSPRTSYQHAAFVLKPERERRDRDFTLAQRIRNH